MLIFGPWNYYKLIRVTNVISLHDCRLAVISVDQKPITLVDMEIYHHLIFIVSFQTTLVFIFMILLSSLYTSLSIFCDWDLRNPMCKTRRYGPPKHMQHIVAFYFLRILLWQLNWEREREREAKLSHKKSWLLDASKMPVSKSKLTRNSNLNTMWKLPKGHNVVFYFPAIRKIALCLCNLIA